MSRRFQEIPDEKQSDVSQHFEWVNFFFSWNQTFIIKLLSFYVKSHDLKSVSFNITFFFGENNFVGFFPSFLDFLGSFYKKKIKHGFLFFVCHCHRSVRKILLWLMIIYTDRSWPLFQQSSTLMVHLANRQLHGDRVGRAVDCRVCRILKIGCIMAIFKKTLWLLKMEMLLYVSLWFMQDLKNLEFLYWICNWWNRYHFSLAILTGLATLVFINLRYLALGFPIRIGIVEGRI